MATKLTVLMLALVVVAARARVLPEPGEGSESGESTGVSSEEEGGCKFGTRTVEEGDVAMSLPDCCLQLVCERREIIPHRVGFHGQVNCCEFGGELYPDGHVLRLCFPLTCRAGRWIYTGRIDDCCKHCMVFDDPHLRTFDGFRYDWHGICNYTLTQTDGGSYEPRVGVFSDFERCWQCASCISHTTFKNDPHTVFSLQTGAVFEIMVNGAPYTVPQTGVHSVTSPSGVHPVLAFRSGACTVLIGSSNLVIQHCQHRLDVWAHPTLTEQLNGLCGHFNYYEKDDFVAREEAGTDLVMPHKLEFWPIDFPHSWKTHEQSDYVCLKKDYMSANWRGIRGNPCNASDHQLQDYLDSCTLVLYPILAGYPDLQRLYLEACTFDLCVMYDAMQPEMVIAEWLRKLFQVALIGRSLHERTEGEFLEARQAKATQPTRTYKPNPVPGTPAAPPVSSPVLEHSTVAGTPTAAVPYSTLVLESLVATGSPAGIPEIPDSSVELESLTVTASPIVFPKQATKPVEIEIVTITKTPSAYP